MADTTLNYDHPTYVSRHLTPMALGAVAASTSARKWVQHSAIKIKKISAIVAIAGTHTSAGWDILNGTTSVGSITAGTTAALGILTALTQDISLSSGGYLDIKTKADSATLAGDVNIEWQYQFNANVVV